MKTKDRSINIVFKHSGSKTNVSLAALTGAVIEFFDIYGTITLAGKEFCSITGEGPGAERFSNLLEKTGYSNDPEGFFSEIISGIVNGEMKKISINQVEIPHLMLVAIIEQIIPGHGYISIKDTHQLTKVTHIAVPENEREQLQKVIEKYPVRLSRHTIRQMLVSKDVAYQYLPFADELDSGGHTNTWIGQFHDGLLEQMYQNRVIFLLNMSCPVYCRFCFRKHKDSRNEANPSVEDVKKAILHVKNSPSIKEIVITGGDPFMNRANMAAAIDGLMQVEHVQTLRLATRSIAYYPDLFLENESAYLKYIKQKNLELQQAGKRMEVATHFIHPDEISPECLEIISDLVKNGIPVYVQTPFLKDCNDKGPELVRLFSLLRGAGAELHYIYIPCSPIHGNSIYWTTLAEGIGIAKYLRANLSDRIIPRICTATPIGKMDWFTSGWAVEKVEDNENFVWIRTPYTPGYFKVFAPLAAQLSNIRINNEGTIDIQYMARIGDESFLYGPRPERDIIEKKSIPGEDIEKLKSILSTERQAGSSIINTGLENLLRVHKTRVEINVQASDKELDYIRKDHRITDIVVSMPKNDPKDIIDSLFYVKHLIKKLQDIPHVNAVRLWSMKFNTNPEAYTRAVINTLGDLNNLRVVNPLRLEIETWFTSADEIRDDHAKLVRRLNNKGIIVYCNTALLGGVNDSDEKIHSLAYAARKAGIEFHHLYIAGLPVQQKWNIDHPVNSYDIVDIATKVRREGSGREIPRYIISTPLGEADYGLTSSFVFDSEDVKIKLNCYDLSYFKSMDENFVLPQGVSQDNDNTLVVPVQGLIKTNSFPIS
ncbi:Radical SAM domain-containing protein [Desulfonema limicola]|uniref:Radical SAM domain-containing protein n=1 Tax=Desulfonema limicola TaxID=45656 RepID=A0A975GE90_9BACT|nr:radical SAM protein [Desulfonema limicola]QTA77996.1 Radical SAM domain-containing protein [Desulfonema limicola]